VIDAFIKTFLSRQHNGFNPAFWQVVAELGNSDAADLCIWRECIADYQNAQAIQDVALSAKLIFESGLTTISSEERPKASVQVAYYIAAQFELSAKPRPHG
jgi:hypothetical protein